VVLYSDNFTESIVKSLRETYRRRRIQDKYNKEHNIIPEKAESNIKVLDVVKTDEVLSQEFS
jgi:excinuclease ABC subunit B